jgi:hypothetical protein
MNSEITPENVRIPAMSYYSNFWYNVSKLDIAENVSDATLKAISAALERTSPKQQPKK